MVRGRKERVEKGNKKSKLGKESQPIDRIW
jgi:hypothetical protein